MIRVDREVKTHQLDKLGVIETQHVAEVSRVIKLRVDGLDFAILEDVAEDDGSDSGEFCN